MLKKKPHALGSRLQTWKNIWVFQLPQPKYKTNLTLIFENESKGVWFEIKGLFSSTEFEFGLVFGVKYFHQKNISFEHFSCVWIVPFIIDH